MSIYHLCGFNQNIHCSLLASSSFWECVNMGGNEHGSWLGGHSEYSS